MKILVINAGSSSMKYQLIDMENEDVIAKGNCERIGVDGFNEYKANGNKIKRDVAFPTHKEAIQDILTVLTDPEIGVIKSVEEIDAVGHRIVQGAEIFSKSEIVTDKVIEEIENLTPLAPLHQPGHVAGIKGCIAAMPNTKQVVVFDTVFHTSSMPDYAYRYAVPKQAYKEWGIRKYGFHGTSHKFVSSELEKIMGKKGKFIICHLGSGASVSAVKEGKCQDTSMGFTPLEGLIMGTRTGDIDPTVVQRIMQKTGKSIDEMVNYLNKECGLLALCGKSDMRDVEDAYLAGDEDATLAINAFCYRIKKYIGSYLAVLNGADAIAFTAGIGERGPIERELVCEGLDCLGIKLDKEKNKNCPKGEFADISAEDSKVKIFVVPTNEEIMIARETQDLVK